MAGVSLLTWLCDLTNLRMMMKKLIYMAGGLFAVISVAVSVVVYYLFRNGLNVLLPAGLLG